MAKVGDQYQGADGNWYSNESDAKMAIGYSGGGGAGGGDKTMSGMTVGFAGIFIIGPIIAAWLVGFLWGLLLKLGIVGRILTTALMLLAGPLILIMPIFFATMAKGTLSFTGSEVEGLGSAAQAVLLTAFMVIPTVWYFFWHYDAVKLMGAFGFAGKIKNFACFVWFGSIIGLVIGLIGSKGIGSAVCYVSAITGIIFYLLTTREYASQAAINPSIKFPVIVKIVVMAIALCIIPIVGIIETAKVKAEIARVVGITSQMNDYFTEGTTVVVSKNRFEAGSSMLSSFKFLKEGTPILNNAMGNNLKEADIVKFLNVGDTLTITGKAVKSLESAFAERYVIPVRHEGTDGFIDVNFIEITGDTTLSASELFGRWLPSETTRAIKSLEILGGGKGFMDGDDMTWTFEKGQLVIIFVDDGVKLTLSCNMQGSTLLLSNRGTTIKMIKQ